MILKVLPYAILGYVADKFAYGYRVTGGNDALNRLMDSLNSNAAFQNPFCMFSDYVPLTLDEWIELDKKRREELSIKGSGEA
jgi:hypothetical protein